MGAPDPPETDYAVDHRLPDADDHVHYDFDPGRDPVLAVDPGDVVRFDCRDATDGSLGPDATPGDVLAMDTPGHALTGPVAVAGAEPGDALVVEVLSVVPGDLGWSYVYPGEEGWGLLAEEFPDAGVEVWTIDRGAGVARLGDGPGADVAVPLAPFPGVLGVAPDADGPVSTTPPRRVGGNLDVKHLTAGSRLTLPVEVEGALFSTGDGHAAQGDGEVCVTGIETATTVDLRFSVREGAAPEYPRFETTGPFTPTGRDEPAVATTGIADDLMAASREAVRGMIAHLGDEYGLPRLRAYVLCSVAVDLKVNEVVDRPNWVVSAYLPESVVGDPD
jgi:acetamidase/formamidase